MNLEKLQNNTRRASGLLKAMSNEHRLLILCQLVEGEKSVGELVRLVGLSQSALSQHLARLRRDIWCAPGARRRRFSTRWLLATPWRCCTDYTSFIPHRRWRPPATGACARPLGRGAPLSVRRALAVGTLRRQLRRLRQTSSLAMRGVLVVVLGLWLSSVPSAPAPAEFVYDLSSRLIAITTAFAGTQVLLYGAAQGSGAAIAVLVRGPTRDTTVRRKSRVGPLWLNTSALEFRAVPSFYAVASSVPLEDLAGPGTLARHELGAERLRLTPSDANGFSQADVDSFRAALIRNRQRSGLFSVAPGTVSFLGDTLFRTRIVLPGERAAGRLPGAGAAVRGRRGHRGPDQHARDLQDGHRGRSL